MHPAKLETKQCILPGMHCIYFVEIDNHLSFHEVKVIYLGPFYGRHFNSEMA